MGTVHSPSETPRAELRKRPANSDLRPATSWTPNKRSPVAVPATTAQPSRSAAAALVLVPGAAPARLVSAGRPVNRLAPAGEGCREATAGRAGVGVQSLLGGELRQGPDLHRRHRRRPAGRGLRRSTRRPRALLGAPSRRFARARPRPLRGLRWIRKSRADRRRSPRRKASAARAGSRTPAEFEYAQTPRWWPRRSVTLASAGRFFRGDLDRRPDVLDQELQIHRIRWRRFEAVVQVEAPGFLVDRVDEE